MALDVHIIGAGKRWPENGSYTSFGFGDEHEGIFQLAHTHVAAGSQLAKMQDYYDDVIYEGDDLAYLIAELNQIIPTLQETDLLQSALEEYRNLCIQAAQDNKAILLFAD